MSDNSQDNVLEFHNFPSAGHHAPSDPGVSDIASTGDPYVDMFLGVGRYHAKNHDGNWHVKKRSAQLSPDLFHQLR
jgi:hypothetical protein